MTKKIAQKNYIFIDTDVFIECITGNFGRKAVSEFKTRLDRGDYLFVLPEIIETEILITFDNWKSELLKKIEDNLSTAKILGISEEVSDKSKKNKKNRNQNSIEVINETINNDRKKLINSIKKSYDLISKEIKHIFKNKNTHIIALDNELLLNGMKRSLLKKAPYTRADKTTENAHTKDADCIAFESLISHLKKERVNANDTLKMCITDKDYFTANDLLQDEVLKDIKKLKIKFSVEDNLYSLLGVKVDAEKNNKTPERLSLASKNTGIDFSSENTIIDVITEKK